MTELNTADSWADAIAKVNAKLPRSARPADEPHAPVGARISRAPLAFMSAQEIADSWAAAISKANAKMPPDAIVPTAAKQTARRDPQHDVGGLR